MFSKIFPKFYRRYYDLISKYQVELKYPLRQGLSEPEFYGDLFHIFQRSLLRQFPFIKLLAITLIYFNILHAWRSTQSRLATLLSSLIPRR